MTNEILNIVTAVVAEGYPVDSVTAKSVDGLLWEIILGVPLWISGSEQADIVAGGKTHAVTVDLDNLPDGVRCGIKTRHPDIESSVIASRGEVAAMMNEVADAGDALDFAASYVGGGITYLTKPTEWLPEGKKRMAKRSLELTRKRREA
jgi:hypothetical protein